MARKNYLMVTVVSESENLESSDLFINDREGAQMLFIEKVKQLDPDYDEGMLEEGLDEGWFSYNDTVIMLIDPQIIHE